MADFVTRGSQSSLGSGVTAIPGTNLRQELVTDETVSRWVAEGRVWGTSVGTVNSPASFLGAVVAVATPELAILVPNGKYIIPLELSMTVITCAAGVWNGPVIITAQNSLGNGTSTAGTAVNLNAAYGGSPASTIRISYTAAGTAATSPLELWRFGTSVAQNPVLLGAPQPPKWGYKTHLMPRVGQTGAISTFQVNSGQAGAATGYITFSFAEFNMGDN